MPQIFHRSSNTLARASIVGGLLLVVALLGSLMLYQRSPYVTWVGVTRDQPIQFSHLHHVGDDGIDCRYCHTTVESAATAGMPSTEICMNCHSQLWGNATATEPIRVSWNTGKPINWTRVYDMPDFVYFNHSAHVNNGVGCATCHGNMDGMNLTWKAQPMSMETCIECHFNPAKYLRPRDQIFNLNYQPPSNQMALGQALVEEYHVQSLTSCSTCHR